jgi:hypothetical protein
VVTVRRARGLAGIGAAFGALIAPACKPDLDETVSVVTQPIVLAVRSEPAESAPLGDVTYTALYVGGSGSVPKPALSWSFCDARNPLANLGPVNTECLQPTGSWFDPIGAGPTASGAVPSDACKNFGPDVPPPVMGQPPGRPVDPDATGGYFQPVRLIAPGGAITLAETRLSCGVAGAPPTEQVAFGLRYHLNTNPSVASLSFASDAAAAAPLLTSDRGANAVRAGAHVTFRVAWTPCPAKDVCDDGVCGPDETSVSCPGDCAMPKGCAGAERFVAFDVETQALVDERESIAVAWFTTAGSFDADRTGRAATDTATTSDNGWQAPSEPEAVHIWVILRDDRGGTGWAEYLFDVR